MQTQEIDKKLNYELEINWQINSFCNFDCVYCYFQGNKRNQFLGLPETKKVVTAFNNIGKKLLISMSGGEPFFFPGFVEFCKEVSNLHTLSINTNLSHKEVFKFAEVINPEKIYFIHCSLHIEQREKLKLVGDFIKKYLFLEKNGFSVFASYVMYPHLLNRFKKDFEYFKSEGIILRPKVFKGNCPRFRITDRNIFRSIRHLFGRCYPDAYTKEQKELIKSHMGMISSVNNLNLKFPEELLDINLFDVWFDRHFIDGLPSFQGKYCYAGNKFVRITPTGDVYRCHSDNRYLGNLFGNNVKFFESPEKCIAKICDCAYFGYIYSAK